MDEIEDIPVEAVAGERRQVTAGDRLMVGLAALALVGGLLIAAGNALDGLTDDGVAAATPLPGTETPRPSRTPRPTATPRPLREVTVEPGRPPEPEHYPNVALGWIEATSELVVWGARSETSGEVRRMAPGEVVLVEQPAGEPDPDGWFTIVDPSPGGSIRTVDDDGTSLAEFYPLEKMRHSGGVASLSAGPDGFLALVWPPARPHEMATPFLATSADGETWERAAVAPDPAFGGWAAAWGPSGWLAVTMVEGRDMATPWLFESSDGSHWAPIGSLEIGSGWPAQMVGSDLGYLLQVQGGDAGGSSAWFSPDGITWQESAPPFGSAVRGFDRFLDGIGLLAADHGFVAWTGFGAEGLPRVAFSANGRSWTEVDVEEAGPGELRLALAGDLLLGIGGSGDGRNRVWTASISDGPAMVLRRAPELEPGLDSVLITSLLSDGTHVVVLGVDTDDERTLAWRSDGGAWRRLPPPDGFGGIPGQAVAGPAGVVVEGSRPTAAGSNPIFWHLRPDGSWGVEPSPLIPLVPDPTPEECGELPATALAFAVLDAAAGPVCFGDSPMTFRAWSVRCDWCEGGPSPTLGPAWLVESSRILQLSPIQSEYGWWRDVVVHPSLAFDDAWSDTWLEVTGHYADAAAEECGRWATEEVGIWALGREAEIAGCRQRFVVTEVTVVDGP